MHKSTLAAESEYFRTLFENDRTGAFAESKTATSTIELVAEGADAFPDFLDYMYRPSEPKLTTENATAIHHFGEYFQMKRLRLLANKFWKEDFAEIPLWSSFAISTCYKHAGVFNNAEIMTAVKNKCCEYCVFPVLATIAIIVPDPQLWLYLLRMGKGTEIFSLIIGKYCKWHDVEADLLTQLTDEKFLPTIHFDAAIILAETERMLMKDAMAAANLSSLQLRCINALANGWDRVDTRGTAFCTFLSHQSHAFVSELHKASLESARKSREAARAHPLRSDND